MTKIIRRIGLLLVFLALVGCPQIKPATSSAIPDPSSDLPKAIKIDFEGRFSMEFVRVSPGRFQMGRNADIFDYDPMGSPSDPNSTPSFTVTITKGYYLSKDNITLQMYATFLNDQKESDRENYTNLETSSTYCQFDKKDGSIVLREDENEPIKSSSWLGAKSFCNWISMKSDMSFRLPTEAEWEFAARGPGNSYDTTWKEISYPRPSPVPPNGIRGLATGYLGNWVEDHFGDFTSTPKVDPTGVVATPHKYKGLSHEVRVLRRPIYSITCRNGGYSGNDAGIYGFRVLLSEDSVRNYIELPEKRPDGILLKEK